MTSPSTFDLRFARVDDCRQVWEINNHPSVRTQSIHQDDIPWDNHVAWFDRRLEDPLCDLFIVECEGDAAGVVRLDIESPSATINIAIQHNYRGRGLGSRSIARASEVVFQTRASIDHIIAIIKPTNVASQRSFAKAGFSKIEDMVLHDAPYQRWCRRRETDT